MQNVNDSNQEVPSPTTLTISVLHQRHLLNYFVADLLMAEHHFLLPMSSRCNRAQVGSNNDRSSLNCNHWKLASSAILIFKSILKNEDSDSAWKIAFLFNCLSQLSLPFLIPATMHFFRNQAFNVRGTSEVFDNLMIAPSKPLFSHLSLLHWCTWSRI